jgi:dihydrofolate synthase/folylpolyglutamate synthase
MTLSHRQAVDYIYSFTNYELTDPAHLPADAWGLDNTRSLLARIGNPHLAYPTLHIAGTKGKGSVAALCAQSLVEAGQRTGLYVSPHLQDFRERIQVDGEWIDPDSLSILVEDIRPHAEALRPDGLTWFEVLTALAFWHFARRDCDAAVIEVGLGGRLDATSLVQPLVSIITNISIDHTQLLGNTLAAIAAEKAAIIKPGVPVVSAPQQPEALRVIERVAAEQGSRLTLVGRDLPYDLLDWSLDGLTLQVGGPPGDGVAPYRVSLAGPHQAENAAVALAALSIAERAGLPVDEAARRKGLAHTRWPGRLEVVGRAPLVLLDSAHNAYSAQVLADALRHISGRERLTLVFGCMADKDVDGMLRALLTVARRVILTQASNPRAVPASDLLARAQRIVGGQADWPALSAASDVLSALQAALEDAAPDDVICVAGSLSVAGEARTAILGPPAVWIDEFGREDDLFQR